MPDRFDGYQIPSWPKTPIDRPLWNATMGDIDARLTAREQLEASFERLMAEGVQASLDYIQVNVAPQIATLQQSISLAQEQIDQIIVGGSAPNALKLGGKEAAWYASAQAVQDAMQDASEAVDTKLADYLRADQKNVADGVAPLGPDSKVPQANLPALTTTATVGAAIAGANGKATPDDGDFFTGVAAGASTMFKTTWGNIKTALTTLFDGRYLRLIGGVVNGSLTIQPSANAAMLEMRAAANGACLIDFSPNGYGGDFNWRMIAQPNNAEFDFLRNGVHLFRVNSDGNLWTAYLGWLSDRFADRGARVQREGGIWEFGSIDPNYNARTTDAPAPYVLVGLRSSNGTNVINLRAELLRNN
ncbi:hypothetical protein [Agrobacterium genomosp. 2]|uniref:Uncharacterized protein n=1 Tax=Agrobacterium genomosp. 2 str. CFBP 5494 TaxID=1183436 RepID=A0A9W5F6J2_9HYPH|nr:hypothetical protein [Agrobacterium genomosp. 2]CUW99293.1 hypothetical protein AGR2A_Lc70068 [Agrobacterium genomosp. 2 str. CFBP 5494]